jgi:hypothetical protein
MGFAIAVSQKDSSIMIFSRIEPHIEPRRRRSKKNGKLECHINWPVLLKMAEWLPRK